MFRTMAWFVALPLLAAVASCSLLNAPDQVKPGKGDGGEGGSGGDGGWGSNGSGSGSSSSSGTGGAKPVCGDGNIEAGETCDPPESCPTSCEDDGNACTSDALEGSAADCTARCHAPILTCSMTSDGCCAAGCTGKNDADCSGCGNNKIDPGETCDGNCPASCDDGDACTLDSLSGSAASCSAVCVHSGTKACVSGDGCCPAGCSNGQDSDCCGNPGGGPLNAENGAGTGIRYCYAAGDSVEVRAQKACDSHFGVGQCCVIPDGYQGMQFGLCNNGGGAGTMHWHWDNHPDSHCDPIYKIGDVVAPGWCGTIVGNFLD
jgi:hypothetical protein